MGLIVEIKAVTSSGRQKLVMDKSGILKCFLKSVPEKGKANKEIIKFLAKRLSISQGDIIITSGRSSRKKRLNINIDLSYQDFLKIFDL